MKAIYLHPEGMGELLFDAAISRLFFFNEEEAQSGYVLIGPAGLREVAQKLLTLADADTTERAGAELGHDLLAELLALRCSPQADALRHVHGKLLALHKLEHFDRAAGGFAVVLTPVLVLGIANLPSVEGCK